MTLVEVLVVFVIMTAALGVITSTLGNVGRLGPLNQETARALDASSAVIEDMRNLDFDELFVRYNSIDTDDPATGISPGPFFAVDGLDLVPGDPDGFVGQVVLADVAGALREDFVDGDLGFPRDLNGDGVLDANDHAVDYGILPVCVRLEWRSRGRTRSYELFTTITRP